jgi:hypothetical protein
MWGGLPCNAQLREEDPPQMALAGHGDVVDDSPDARCPPFVATTREAVHIDVSVGVQNDRTSTQGGPMGAASPAASGGLTAR